ncbi:MAG: DUF4136 domain-containing protein [Maribacter sp.]|nr:DUF4136 domain-containing protein [Maribacter sp.]
MKGMGYIALALLLTSCHVVRVSMDYEKETDFSNYSTYNYYNDLETGLSELDEKRLIKLLDVVMLNEGILLSEEPDFFINIQSRSFQTSRNNTVGVGVGGTGRNVGGGLSIGIPVGKPSLALEIQFDFVDSQKDALFWQAISKCSFNENSTPIEREQKLGEIVEKVLSKYPPKSKR